MYLAGQVICFIFILFYWWISRNDKFIRSLHIAIEMAIPKLTKAILLLQFHLCYVRCCLIFKCFKCSNFNNCVSNFFNLVEVTQ